MCAKLLKNSDPKRILIVSMSNIGDVVLTCPVIDILRHDFPQAKIDIVTGPKSLSLFKDNPNFTVKVFEKRAPLKQRIEWFLDLYRLHYDCVIDLRRTALALFLMPRYATSLFLGNSFIGHKKEAHLDYLRHVYNFKLLSDQRSAVVTTYEDIEFFQSKLLPFLNGQDFVVIAPGAADSAKRWHPKGFSAIADHLALKYKIVFVGDINDVKIIEEIRANMKSPSLSLAGQIHLRQLAFVLKKSSWALTHDSGVMHLASYFNVPLLVLWGPTSIEKYAPWSEKSVIVRCNEQCERCQNPKSKVLHNCMSFIQIEDVLKAIRKIQ